MRTRERVINEDLFSNQSNVRNQSRYLIAFTFFLGLFLKMMGLLTKIFGFIGGAYAVYQLYIFEPSISHPPNETKIEF